MAPSQLSMSNVADPDIFLGSVPGFLSCLSANGATARPFGPALPALFLLGLHSVTRVPFFTSEIVSTSELYTFLLSPFPSLHSAASTFVFS